MGSAERERRRRFCVTARPLAQPHSLTTRSGAPRCFRTRLGVTVPNRQRELADATRANAGPGRAGASENEAVTEVPTRLRPLLDPDSPVQQLAGRLRAAGHSCYLVGGTVRDALLDRAHGDADIATSARPDETERIVRGWADHVWLQGQRFGTVGCEVAGMRLEITTFRAEVYRPESRKPEVAFADDLETDLSRRDFTINAMA